MIRRVPSTVLSCRSYHVLHHLPATPGDHLITPYPRQVKCGILKPFFMPIILFPYLVMALRLLLFTLTPSRVLLEFLPTFASQDSPVVESQPTRRPASTSMQQVPIFAC